MRKRFCLLILAILFVFVMAASAQSADAVTAMINTKKVSTEQAAYFFAVMLDLVPETATEQEAVDALVSANYMKAPKNPSGPISYAQFCGLCMKSWNLPAGLMYSITKSNHYAFREMQTKGNVDTSIDPSAPISGYNAMEIITKCLLTEEGEL